MMAIEIEHNADGSITINGVKINSDSRICDEKIVAAAAFVDEDDVSADDTTTTLAGTWYPIGAAFTNRLLNEFTAIPADPSIRYDDGEDWFEFRFHGAFTCDSANATVKVSINVYDSSAGTWSVDDGCRGSTFMKNAGQDYNIGGMGVLQLDTNDKVQLVIQSNKAGANFTTVDFSTILKRLR